MWKGNRTRITGSTGSAGFMKGEMVIRFPENKPQQTLSVSSRASLLDPGSSLLETTSQPWNVYWRRYCRPSRLPPVLMSHWLPVERQVIFRTAIAQRSISDQSAIKVW